MDSFIKIKVPVKHTICSDCRASLFRSQISSRNLNIIYNVELPGKTVEKNDSFEIALDVKKIKWISQGNGQLSAYAEMYVDCPICNNQHKVDYEIEAPKTFLQHSRICPDCGQQMRFREKEMEFEERDDKPYIFISGDLICDHCMRTEGPVEMYTDMEIDDDKILIKNDPTLGAPLSGQFAYELFEKDLLRSCQKAQGNTLLLFNGKENDINTYLRDMLDKPGVYYTFDQSLNGKSPGGYGAGELDLLIKSADNEPRAVIEAIVLDSISKERLTEHIGKIFLYDTFGNPVNYLVVYARTSNFAAFIKRYKNYLKSFNSFEISGVEMNSYEEVKNAYTEVEVINLFLTRSGKATRLSNYIVHFGNS